MAFYQTQFQDFHISLKRSLTFSSCNLDDLRPVFTQGRAELAPICKLHELFLQPNSGLQAPVKTDWREPTCFILDIAWAQVNGLNEREQRTENRERETLQRFWISLSNAASRCFAAVHWSRYKLNVLFWWTFGGKLLPFITSALTTISLARGGAVGGFRESPLMQSNESKIHSHAQVLLIENVQSARKKWGVSFCSIELLSAV